MLASRTATTYIDRGREYDVIVQAAGEDRDVGSGICARSMCALRIPTSWCRSMPSWRSTTGPPPPTSGGTTGCRASLVSAALEDGLRAGHGDCGCAGAGCRDTPCRRPGCRLADCPKEFLESSSGIHFSLMLAVAIIYLVLAAQFESFVQPFRHHADGSAGERSARSSHCGQPERR